MPTPQQLDYARIPQRFRKANAQDFSGAITSFKLIEHYTNKHKSGEHSSGLWFWGLPESGKTWLMCYTTMWYLEIARLEVLYLTHKELIDFSYRGQDMEMIERINNADVLAIDHVDTPDNEGYKSILYSTLRTRRDRMKITMAASSLSPKQIPVFYGERFAPYMTAARFTEVKCHLSETAKRAIEAQD